MTLSTNTKVVVSEVRERKTEAPEPQRSFGQVLAEGANVVLEGVQTAASIVGGPLMSGAVQAAGEGIAYALGGQAGAGGATGGTDAGTFDQVRALQEQAQAFNLEYLAIQQEVQQENRRFTALSNVAKSMHDTNKAVLQNVRS
ncbi:MAG: hypothetical protein D6689_00935 [Deltaproteobacteria bacterium]|nr:MAG: hypothetical protein D6689_00935 [Deltaproteobacteria bacterium]